MKRRARRGIRRLLALAAVGLGLIQAGCTQSLKWSAVDRMIRADFPDVPALSTDSLAALLAGGTRPLLLDTRPVAEYAVSHLRDAVRIDPETTDFAFLDTLARDAMIVTYCSVGYRSAGVARRLRAAGFTQVYNLQGSLFRWANEGRPLYRGDSLVHVVHPYDRLWGTLLREELRAYAPR